MSSISITFEVQPFPVPSEVITIPDNRLPGLGKTQKMNFELSQIDADQLSKMCDDYREAVFSKACKHDPRMPQKRVAFPVDFNESISVPITSRRGVTPNPGHSTEYPDDTF